jgi:hypothetical protein
MATTVFTEAGHAATIDHITAQNGTGFAAAPSDYFIGWGSGGGVAAITDTTLFAEIAGTRPTAVVTQSAPDTLQVVATLTASGAQVPTNAAFFDADAAGTMYVKGDHAATSLEDGESIQYTVTLQLKDQGE